MNTLREENVTQENSEAGYDEYLAKVCKNEKCGAELCHHYGHCMTVHNEDPADPCRSARLSHGGHS